MANKKRRLQPNEVDRLKDTSGLMKKLKKEYKQNNPDIIEYNNTSFPIQKVMLSPHAMKRVGERLNVKVETEAVGHIRNRLKNAKCVGVVMDNEGNESVLFSNANVGIYMNTDLKEVRTVIIHDRIYHKPIKDKIATLIEKEVRKLTRKEHARIRHLEEVKLESAIECAELELRLHRTRSEAVRLACKARLKAIDQSIQEMEGEIVDLQSQKRQVARSYVSINAN